MAEFKQLCFRFPPDIHRQLRMVAAATGKTQTEVLMECIQGAYRRIQFKSTQEAVEQAVSR